jgi:uncharacterized protein YndB with AHSA1/START domain
VDNDEENEPNSMDQEKTMLGTIAIVIGILLAILLAYAATRPNSFRVQRSLEVQAPPERIFALINDFHKWELWSPYEKLDPAMKKTYSGPVSGTGAAYAWSGNSKAGEGRMEILSTVPQWNISIKLDFLKPFEGHNTAEFSMEPRAGATKVTWAMYGPQKFMLKLMSIFLSMDKMVGKDFERGLANIKAVAERKVAVTK